MGILVILFGRSGFWIKLTLSFFFVFAVLACLVGLPFWLAVLTGHPWPGFDASPWHYESLFGRAQKLTKNALRGLFRPAGACGIF